MTWAESAVFGPEPVFSDGSLHFTPGLAVTPDGGYVAMTRPVEGPESDRLDVPVYLRGFTAAGAERFSVSWAPPASTRWLMLAGCGDHVVVVFEADETPTLSKLRYQFFDALTGEEYGAPGTLVGSSVALHWACCADGDGGAYVAWSQSGSLMAARLLPASGVAVAATELAEMDASYGDAQIGCEAASDGALVVLTSGFGGFAGFFPDTFAAFIVAEQADLSVRVPLTAIWLNDGSDDPGIADNGPPRGVATTADKMVVLQTAYGTGDPDRGFLAARIDTSTGTVDATSIGFAVPSAVPLFYGFASEKPPGLAYVDGAVLVTHNPYGSLDIAATTLDNTTLIGGTPEILYTNDGPTPETSLAMKAGASGFAWTAEMGHTSTGLDASATVILAIYSLEAAPSPTRRVLMRRLPIRSAGNTDLIVASDETLIAASDGAFLQVDRR